MQFENTCPKSGVSPHDTNWEPKNHLFRRFRDLTATLTAYIFGTKHDIDNLATAFKTVLRGVSYILTFYPHISEFTLS